MMTTTNHTNHNHHNNSNNGRIFRLIWLCCWSFSYCYNIRLASSFGVVVQVVPTTTTSIHRQQQQQQQQQRPLVKTNSLHRSTFYHVHERSVVRRFLSSSSPDDQDNAAAGEDADLLAAFLKAAKAKGIELEAEDLTDDDDDEDDEEEDEKEDEKDARKGKSVSSKQQQDDDDDEDGEDDDDDDDDEEEINIPQGAINAFLGYDTGDVGEKLAGNVTLTNDQLYSEVRERVLDTAGGFVDFVRRAAAEEEEDDDDEDDDDDGDVDDLLEVASKLASDKKEVYQPPTLVPDSDLTAGEVVILVLQALLHNDVPTPNRGVEILFGYSSPGSQIKNEVGLTPAEYADFLKETEYKVLFEHQDAVIDKGDYSFDGKKAYFTARLRVGQGPLDVVSVNFILSTTGVEEDDCWLIDSILIRPQSMRRRRRR